MLGVSRAWELTEDGQEALKFLESSLCKTQGTRGKGANGGQQSVLFGKEEQAVSGGLLGLEGRLGERACVTGEERDPAWMVCMLVNMA